MWSISLLPIGFLALVWGLHYFYKKLNSATGSVIIMVIGAIGVYIGIILSDLILSSLGLQQFYYSINTEYYLYQAALYIIIGGASLCVYYLFLQKTTPLTSLSFWWIGVVLMITGSSDLIINSFAEASTLELRLGIAVGLLIILLVVANKYGSRIFESNTSNKVTAKPVAKPTKEM